MMSHQIARVINQLALGGAQRMLCAILESEERRGFIVIRPGMRGWFPRENWKPDSLCSIDDNRVRIVLVEARFPNSGAFKALLDGIHNDGLIPVVVEPVDWLAIKLAEWGFRRRHHGHGDDAEEVWYPRP